MSARVADGVETPGLTAWAKVVDGKNGRFVQTLRRRIDYLGDAEHGRDIDVAVDGYRAAPEGRDLPTVGARTIFRSHVLASSIKSLGVDCHAVNFLVRCIRAPDHGYRHFEVFHLAGFYIYSGDAV